MQLIVNEICQTKDPEEQKEKRLNILKQLMGDYEPLLGRKERGPDFTYRKTENRAAQAGKCHG